MLLYHGSNLIVKKPELVKQSRGLDFGTGFYLTSREEQAVRFAEIVVNRRKCGIAKVSVFDFDEDIIDESFNVLRFVNAERALSLLKFVKSYEVNKNNE